MKNARVKVRLKNNAVEAGTIKDTVILRGDTHYMVEFMDSDNTKVVMIIHCNDIVEVMA